MSKRPFMQLYVSDFLGDTQHLSAEEIGAYMLLLMTMWQRDGKLPMNEKTLSRVARIAPEQWPTVWASLADFFTVEDGEISQERLSDELGKFARKSAARSEAGRRGGHAKALKDKKSGVANAMAKRWHLPDTRIKKGNASPDPTDSVVLDRYRADQENLFKTCEEISGQKIPDYMQRFSFSASVVAEARKRLAH
jgi:uncharacterized protein YdaU (DUF1376 family)